MVPDEVVSEFEASLNAEGVAYEDALEKSITLRTAKHSEGPLHEIADAHIPKIAVALRFAFAKARREVPHGETNIEGALKVMSVTLLDLLPKVLHDTYVDAYGTAFEGLRVAAKGEVSSATKWASQHAAELVKGITKTTRDWVREAITARTEGVLSPKDTWQAIADIIGDEDRAQTIARTEAMRASNAGQRGAWDDAKKKGLLPEKQKKTWIFSDLPMANGQYCPICEGMDGVTVPLDDSFNVDGEEIDGPPAHPDCRCTEGLV